MGTLEAAIRVEMRRAVKAAAGELFVKGESQVARLAARVGELEREAADLRKRLKSLASQSKLAAAAATTNAADGNTRLSPKLIKKLRKRLNVSQPELAALLGVSPAAVGFWESGRVRPRPDLRARIVALRDLGRRDVKRLLAEKKSAAAPG